MDPKHHQALVDGVSHAQSLPCASISKRSGSLSTGTDSVAFIRSSARGPYVATGLLAEDNMACISCIFI
jgi:hypothetical protein